MRKIAKIFLGLVILYVLVRGVVAIAKGYEVEYIDYENLRSGVGSCSLKPLEEAEVAECLQRIQNELQGKEDVVFLPDVPRYVDLYPIKCKLNRRELKMIPAFLEETKAE